MPRAGSRRLQPIVRIDKIDSGIIGTSPCSAALLRHLAEQHHLISENMLNACRNNPLLKSRADRATQGSATCSNCRKPRLCSQEPQAPRKPNQLLRSRSETRSLANTRLSARGRRDRNKTSVCHKTSQSGGQAGHETRRQENTEHSKTIRSF